jgi:hypothetical protein
VKKMHFCEKKSPQSFGGVCGDEMFRERVDYALASGSSRRVRTLSTNP